MLRVDPAQQRRLGEIIVNLRERIAEARENGWLGEVEGLQVSLGHARDKMAAIRRATSPGTTSITDLGIPTIRDAN
jgi:hypothetical protein